MDMVVHWGVLRHLRKDVKANPAIVITALVFDLVVLAAFLWVKVSTDLFVVVLSGILMVVIFAGEKWFLKGRNKLTEQKEEKQNE
ncbi:MAG: hypothetical protein U5L96_06945 [Owenweeksia sp.]|nr:hypothetical protein [Owenweeksia sp.]